MCKGFFFFVCVCVFVSVSWSLSCVSFFGLKKQRERDRDREIWFWENHGVKDVSFRFRSSVFSWVSFLILSWRFQKVLFCFCFFFFLFSFFGYTFLLFILLYFSSYLLNNFLTILFFFPHKWLGIVLSKDSKLVLRYNPFWIYHTKVLKSKKYIFLKMLINIFKVLVNNLFNKIYRKKKLIFW